jgi:AcrR family transcriptional regulator
MVKSPKGGKRARTRERLVAATVQIIAEQGFEAASVEEIAARAGVTTGSIYSNYRSKADLLWDAAQRHELRLDVSLTGGIPLTAQARAVARAVIAILPQSKASADFHRDLQMHLRADPELWRRQASQYREMFDAFAAQLTALHGHEMTIDPRHLAIAAQALIWGYTTQWMQSPEEITEEVVAAGFEALARGATKPD